MSSDDRKRLLYFRVQAQPIDEKVLTNLRKLDKTSREKTLK